MGVFWVSLSYIFDVTTGRYNWGDGEGKTYCPNCGADISFEQGFEEGPLNYRTDPDRFCFNCKHIERGEDGGPVYDEELRGYRCLYMGDNGKANNPKRSRDSSECCGFHPVHYELTKQPALTKQEIDCLEVSLNEVPEHCYLTLKELHKKLSEVVYGD